jgi:hypothetical protein
VFLRRALSDKAGGDEKGATGVPTLICGTEARVACEALDHDGVIDARIESSGVTADRLAHGRALGADGWLTATFWPGMVDVERSSDPDLEPLHMSTSEPLASTNVVVAHAPSLDPAQLTSTCGGPLSWGCISDHAGASPFRIGIDPTTDTSGLATATVAANGIVGGIAPRPEEMEDTALSRWQRLASQVQQGRAGAALTTLATVQGQFDLAGGLESQRSRRTPSLDVEPVAAIALVVAGHPDRFDLGAIRDTLVRTGFQRGGATQGLPGPGVMVALRNEWDENAS